LAVIGDENAGRAPARQKESCSMKRLGQRLSREAQNLRKQAEGMPAGIQRDDLLKESSAGRLDLAVNDWISSPGQQPPE
jgi:hypothetical protein